MLLEVYHGAADAQQQLQGKKSIAYIAPPGIPAALKDSGADQRHDGDRADIKEKEGVHSFHILNSVLCIMYAIISLRRTQYGTLGNAANYFRSREMRSKQNIGRMCAGSFLSLRYLVE